MNVGMDYYLFGADRELQSETMLRLLTFFRDEGFEHGQFEVDGSNPTGNYTIGMTGANAVGAIALHDEKLKRQYLQMLWDARPPKANGAIMKAWSICSQCSMYRANLESISRQTFLTT